jgi:hypothetical protein
MYLQNIAFRVHDFLSTIFSGFLLYEYIRYFSI